MGSNNIFTRCSERIVSRNLALRLGYTPPHDVVAANCQSADNSRHLAFASDIQEAPHIAIAHDINLNRDELSELSATMADEARVATIEGKVTDMVTDVTGLKDDVNELKTDVAGINDKMDKLIRAMDSLNPTQMQNTEHRHTHQDSATSPQRDGVGRPPQNNQASQANMATSNQSNYYHMGSQRHANAHAPHTATAHNGRRMSPEEFVQKEMNRDAFTYPESGNSFVSHTVGPAKDITKPYMYLYRDGVSTARQKLDARQSITATEYIDAMLALLADPRAYHPDDYQDIFHHLRKVSRDILERPWCVVRRWTQYVWDLVEAGSISWADRDIIQEERVRICLTGASNQSNNSNSSTYQIPARRQHGMQEVTCRAFNSRSGCPQRDSHQDGQVFALHICNYCDSIGRACYHSIRECERRVTHSKNDNQYQFRNRQHGHPQQQYNQYHNNQFPKNGFQAHQ